jgi:hypothetical protein
MENLMAGKSYETILDGRDESPLRVRPGIEIAAWPELKFARALEHARRLQSQIESWNATAPVSTDKVIDSNGLSADVLLRLRTDPPLHEWSLTLGDCIHDLRSALDALVWELSHLDGNTPKTPRTVQFPICETENQWDSAIAGSLSSVPDRLRLTQPFLYDSSQISAISLLHELDVQDKRRSQITMTVRTAGIDLKDCSVKFEDEDQIPDPPFKLQAAPTIAVKNGNPILRITSTARMIEVSSPMTIIPTFAIDLDGSQLALHDTLNTVIGQVRATLTIAYLGLPSTEAPDGGEWIPFDLQIVESLE